MLQEFCKAGCRMILHRVVFYVFLFRFRKSVVRNAHPLLSLLEIMPLN